jgi:hypothetical protein
MTALARLVEVVPRLKEDAMKLKIGLALAAGLALFVAGCSGQSSSAGGTSGGGAASAPAAPVTPSVSATSKNFNLAVKCPGVHYEKSHGWSDAQIMQQESIEEEDIPACEEWAKAQPKGYVPPPPPGTVAAKSGAQNPGGGAAAPTKQ